MMLRSGMINTFANATQRAAVLLIYVVAGRNIDTASFGIASSLVALALTIGSLSSLSLGHTANRTLSRIRVTRLRHRMAVVIAQISLFVSIASAVFFYIFSKSLVGFVTGQAISGPAILAVTLAVFAISIGSCLKGHIWAEMRYSTLLTSSVVSSAVLFAAYGFFMALTWPLPLLHAYAAMTIVEALILGLAVVMPLARGGGLFSFPTWRHLRPVLRFSGLATLNGLIFTPVNILLIAMINASLGTEVVGRFNILVQIRNAIVFLPNGFASVILTLMSRERRPDNLLRNSLMLGSLAGLVSMPIGVLAYVWRPVDTGPDFAMLLAITSMTGMIIAFNTSIGQAFIAVGRLWTGITANVIWSVTTLGLVAVALSGPFGNLGAVLTAVLLAYVLHTVVQFTLIRRTKTRLA